jgi:hypothetical protein
MTISHPRFSELNRFADEELSSRRRKRVVAHLGKCTECRKKVLSIRNLKRDIQDVPGHPAPAVVLQQVLERRDAGERIILPLADPPAKRIELWHVLSGMAAATALVALVALFSTREARADWSELRFKPERPERGATIEVSYRATSMFAGEDHLNLRAHFRRPPDSSYNYSATYQVVTELLPDGDHVYSGTFQLPDSVVYASFAVEDPSGQRVDSKGSALWELLVHKDGKPEYAALDQRRKDWMGRSWEVLLETAELASQDYPESVEALFTFWSVQQMALGEAGFESGQSARSARFSQLHERYSRDPSLSGDVLGYMYWISNFVVDSTRYGEYWLERLLKEAPAHPLAVQQRVLDIERKSGADDAAKLADLEALWNEVGPVQDFLPLAAMRNARNAGDSDAFLRWADRDEAMRPEVAWSVAVDLLDIPALREEGIARLRRVLQAADNYDDSRRPLDVTVDQQRILDQRPRRLMLAELGEALVAVGKTKAGLDTLALAASDGWDPEVFQTIAEVKWALGDTTAALEMFSRVAVDPTMKPQVVDSVTSTVRMAVSAHEWSRSLATARDEFTRRVRSQMTDHAITGDVVLRDASGKERRLQELTGGKTTLLVRWFYDCVSCVENWLGYSELDWLRRGDVTVLVLLSQAPSEEFRRRMAEGASSIPVLNDARGTAYRALNVFLMPNYVVLDPSLHVRYQGGRLDQAIRVVAALGPTDHRGVRVATSR